MIQEATLYTIECNKCREQLIDDSNDCSAWYDKDTANEIAILNGWEVTEDRHLCPACQL